MSTISASNSLNLIKRHRKILSVVLLGWIVILTPLYLQPNFAANLEHATNAVTAIEEQTVQAEIIWVEFDGLQHLLRHSQYKTDYWSSPKTIYATNNPITTPTLAQLDSSSNTADFALWTEQRKTKTVLMQTRRIQKDAWQPATQFYSGGTNNFAPFVINDLNGNTWVFWSLTQAQNLSDVVFSIRQDGAAAEGNIANGWSAPKAVHPLNKVPDIVPIAILDKNGDIQVYWQTYDFSVNNYVQKSTTLKAVVNTQNQQTIGLDPQHIDPIQLASLPVPDFIPDRGYNFTLFSALNKVERAIVRQK